MTALYKWAWCQCPKCKEPHHDLVHFTQPTENRNGAPIKVKQICDRCYTAAMSTNAANAYRAHKERVAQCLPSTEQQY